MLSKLTVNSKKKKAGECCYPKCECPGAKKKPKPMKTRKKSRKKSGKYKASEWTDALALRPPRCLISSIMEYVGSLPIRIIDVFYKYYQLSVQTIYSKKFVAEEYRPQLMSKKIQDWKQHRKWLTKRAQPKIDYSELGQRNPRVPFDKLSRYKYLSEPRWPRRKFDDNQEIHFDQAITTVTQAAMEYKLTETTLKLARVLERFKQKKFIYDYRPAPTVSSKALRAKCRPRTILLAVPKQLPVQPKRKETKYGVAVSALAYNIKERTQFLAKPKPIYMPRVKDEEDAIVIEERDLSEYGVSVTALKYVATNNILALATPKQPPPEIPYVDKKRTKYNIVASALAYRITDRMQKLSKSRHAVRKK